ncbi:hypothetical protein Nepgr_001029 [Nepenthes gracilis]|uniref:Uncharacterized protein n=1 Tax=Nepenthes gracilis TaxID=150966 RepID=A0AAD3P2A4_NEPGR|nr:hypothetical protein Nepgr_001029 [Nepenthes gracilis]
MENRRASAAVSARPKTPEPASEEHSENPNWLSGLIYPARVIATGAGKILSTVFGPDSSLSSSSMGDSSSAIADCSMLDVTCNCCCRSLLVLIWTPAIADQFCGADAVLIC